MENERNQGKWSQISKPEQLSILLIFIGTSLAILDRVRAGSVILALGTAGFAFLKYKRVGMKRRIELFLPLAIACALFVVAVTLPHAR